MELHKYVASYKVIFLGDRGVGKKTLTSRSLTNLFKSDEKMTLGVNFEVKSMEIDGKKIKLQVWLFEDKERFRFLLPTYTRAADGALFIYDVTNYSSLTHIDDWLSVVRKQMKSEQNKFPIVVVGNKADLEDARVVSGEEGIEFAKSKGVDGFIECSAKTGENVEEVFDALTRLMMQRSRLI